MTHIKQYICMLSGLLCGNSSLEKRNWPHFSETEGVGVQILKSDRKTCSKQKKQGFLPRKTFFFSKSITHALADLLKKTKQYFWEVLC